MTLTTKALFITVVLPILFNACISGSKEADKEILNSIPFHKVVVNDDFWYPRMVIQKDTLLPFSLDKTIPAVENLKKTAAFLQGNKDDLPFVHRYIASDLYKVMEGAAYLLRIERNPEMEARMDSIIDIIAAAQAPDGYHYESHITGVAKYDKGGMGDSPYSYVVHSHELYNMGHMYEGAIAYYQATGKDKWLKVAEKNARHINKVFFEGDPAYNNGKPVNQAPGHQEIELALVKMYSVTGDTLYLNMAKKFLDIRGVTYQPKGSGVLTLEYAQQHLPVREQTKAVGHAVRATYLYCAMADVSRATGDASLRPALDSIWHDIVDTKMHITGGLGAVHGIEGFGPEYVLPNKDTYNETCAGVGNVLFNHRMFLLEADGKYMDVAEVALFNSVLVGVNLNGNRFFYVNPLEADGITPFNHGNSGRSPWFGTACCPSNLARLIPQVSGMMYAVAGNTLYCSLYAGNNTTVDIKGNAVQIDQQTNYPFDENILLKINPEMEGTDMTLKLRIPTWTGSQFVPGKLYSYMDKDNTKQWSVSVNGKILHPKVEKGFISISREWNKGDVVELILPQPLRYSQAIELVENDLDRTCITKGPLVYCAEGIDNKDIIPNIILSNIGVQSSEERTDYSELRGIKQLIIPVHEKTEDNTSSEFSMSVIPYYAWNNRGNGSMMVWFPVNENVQPYIDHGFISHGKFKSLKASHTWSGDILQAVADNILPEHSFDNNIHRWTSWPEKGKKQWIEFELEEPTDIQSISVYWYDDGDRGGVHIPASWNLEYRSENTWKPFPLYITDNYNTFKDQFNMVHPARKITTDAFRLNMQPRQDSCVGVLEILVAEE